MWVVLSGSFSQVAVITGIVVSVCCLYFSRKYLPSNKTGKVSFLKLALYPFYLIGQIYISAFYVMKIILTGAKVDIIEADTKITNEFLRNVLSISITLTPGSIMLDLNDGRLFILWLRGINDIDMDTESAGELIKGKLEKKLLKAQR